ncbi:hypothetical protein [Burkholderia sp. MSMB1835]|uniref:hypothetical protein n=1 Tax=Burkholderia sp. MSMB1835 TaxID=1637876 RepID=UPI000757C381|nr:hypothetical protein [Burkholderia sp. MSMB1835]KVL40415.1 hypothetical protein WS96_03980 [Burkholderia sp. MSMB1835]
MFKTAEILKILSTCEPYRPAKGLSMERTKKLAWLLLASGGVCFLLLASLALWYKLAPVAWLRYPAFALYVLTMLLSLLSLIVEPIAGIVQMFRWKQETLNTITHEVEIDEKNAQRLISYDDRALEYARHCLQLKVKRLDTRVASVFGGGTAVYALLAVTIANIKDAGGLPWLQNTMVTGLVPGNFMNTTIAFGIALVFGMSVGSMVLKVVQSRYTYQLELIESALLRKSFETSNKNDEHR